MKDIILGRTLSHQSVLSFIEYLLEGVHMNIDEKALLKGIPMHAILNMYEIEQCLACLDMKQYDTHPSLIVYNLDQPTPNCLAPAKVFLSKELNQHPQQNLHNMSKRESRSQSPLLESCRKKTQRVQSISKDIFPDFSNFSVKIDLGFTSFTNLNEDMIRRRKQEEEKRKMERQEADLKKMINREKMDRQMIDALTKDKKQVGFTYDYDGLLLPVNKIETSKLPATNYQMRYSIGSCQNFVAKQPEHQPKTHRNTLKAKTHIHRTLLNVHTERRQDQLESSQFYRNFQTTQLVPGSTLRYLGKQLTNKANVPKMDFFTSRCKYPGRIQQKHYFEYIKQGNLKRFEKENENKAKQLQCKSGHQNINMTSRYLKRARKFKSSESIVINNSQLLNDLKANNWLNSNFKSQLIRRNTKVRQVNPLDQFNISTLAAQNRMNSLQQSSKPANTKRSKMIQFGSIHRAATTNKMRVRKSILNMQIS